jgi:uncharacterized membrane protein
VPNLGASGAIAGIMGAYLAIYPGSTIDLFVWPLSLFIRRDPRVPAWLMLGVWFALQVVFGLSWMSGVGRHGGHGLPRACRRLRHRLRARAAPAAGAASLRTPMNGVQGRCLVVSATRSPRMRRTRMEVEPMADRVIVAVFGTQNQAYDTATALQRLSNAGTITLKRGAIVTKDDKGNLIVPDSRDIGGPWGLLGGSLIGAMMGALLGPAGAAAGVAAGTAVAAGAAIGAATGGSVGAVADLLDLGLSQDFIDEVSHDLEPGQSALIAEIGEGSTEPVNAVVTRHQGRIHRATLG